MRRYEVYERLAAAAHALLLDIAKAAFGALHDECGERRRWCDAAEEAYGHFKCCAKIRLAVGEMLGVGCWQADSKR